MPRAPLAGRRDRGCVSFICKTFHIKYLHDTLGVARLGAFAGGALCQALTGQTHAAIIGGHIKKQFTIHPLGWIILRDASLGLSI